MKNLIRFHCQLLGDVGGRDLYVVTGKYINSYLSLWSLCQQQQQQQWRRIIMCVVIWNNNAMDTRMDLKLNWHSFLYLKLSLRYEMHLFRFRCSSSSSSFFSFSSNWTINTKDGRLNVQRTVESKPILIILLFLHHFLIAFKVDLNSWRTSRFLTKTNPANRYMIVNLWNSVSQCLLFKKIKQYIESVEE